MLVFERNQVAYKVDQFSPTKSLWQVILNIITLKWASFSQELLKYNEYYTLKKLLNACKRLGCTKSMRDFIVKDESQSGLTTRQMTLPKSVIPRSPDFTWLHVWQVHSELCIHRSNISAISKITQGTQLLNLLGEQPYYPEDLQ